MKEKVLSTIKKYNLVKQGDKVVVGVSGGPDSACLLHLLSSVSDDLGIELHAVHINHMLRGDEALRDQKYVEKLCSNAGIPLYSISIDVKSISKNKGISVEEAGREARYAEFHAYADKVGAQCIAVAHNRNDQAETVFMNIIRGSGLDGLTGMDYKRGRIIRPLLDISRNEIEQYCKDYELKPVTDSTNLENIYTRNKIRLDLIPQINSLFNANLVDSLCRMSSILKDDEAYIGSQAETAFKRCMSASTQGISLRLDCIREFHPAIAGRVLRLAVSELKGSLKGIGSVHVESLYKLALKGRTGARVCLPGGISASKGYESLEIMLSVPDDTTADFLYNLDVPGRTFVKVPDLTSGKAVDAVFDCRLVNMDGADPHAFKQKSDSFIQFFDCDKMKSGIYIRNRRSGDVFKPIGANGGKKLKEYMIDHKVPRNRRSKIPLVVMGNEIVWIVGDKISDKFKATENTKSMLRIEYRQLVGNEKF